MFCITSCAAPSAPTVTSVGMHNRPRRPVRPKSGGVHNLARQARNGGCETGCRGGYVAEAVAGERNELA